MAQQSAQRRQQQQRAAPPASARPPRREAAPIHDRAAEWAPSSTLASRSDSESLAGSEESLASSEESWDDPGGVIDLAYIVRVRPPASVVRGFMRAQVRSVKEAFSDDEFE
jgi:hypothetical protein